MSLPRYHCATPLSILSSFFSYSSLFHPPCKKTPSPGIEPGAQTWEACMLPTTPQWIAVYYSCYHTATTHTTPMIYWLHWLTILTSLTNCTDYTDMLDCLHCHTYRLSIMSRHSILSLTYHTIYFLPTSHLCSYTISRFHGVVGYHITFT